jgi:hypothetical protein
MRLNLRRLPLPLRVGLLFAAAGLVLAVVGIARGNVPLNPLSIFLALLISGGSWGLVSWAVATAVVDVEGAAPQDLNETAMTQRGTETPDER